jgi:ribonuclease P protein subunit POP4
MDAKEPPTALKLLLKSHDYEIGQKIYTERILQKPLHLHPTSTPPTTQVLRRETRLLKKSQRKRKKALKPAPLSSRQLKSLSHSSHQLPGRVSYSNFVPLHELWVKYIQDLLGLTTVQGIDDGNGNGNSKIKRSIGVGEMAKLCSADYHGAFVEVVRSKCVSRVGIKGIVVRDGMRAFEIICLEGSRSGDRGVVKSVPKEGTVFGVVVALPVEVGEGGKEGEQVEEGKRDLDQGVERGDNGKEKEKEEGKSLKFELHGDQFIYRAADRANRKFKTHFDRNL